MTFAELIGKLLTFMGWWTLAIMAAGLLGAACKWIKERCARDS